MLTSATLREHCGELGCMANLATTTDLPAASVTLCTTDQPVLQDFGLDASKDPTRQAG